MLIRSEVGSVSVKVWRCHCVLFQLSNFRTNFNNNAFCKIILSFPVIMQRIWIHFTTIRKEIWNRSIIGCFTCGVLHKSFWHTDCPKFTNYTIYHDARIWTITSTSISCNIFGIVILTTSNIIYIIILHFNFSPHLFFTTLIWIVFHWHSQFRFFVINNLAWQIEQFDFFLIWSFDVTIKYVGDHGVCKTIRNRRD